MLGILSFVMLTHFLVEKCINYWSIEVSDTVVDVENQETDEHLSIFDFYSVLNYIIIISFIYFLRFSLQYYLLSPRISLLLKDAEIVFELTIIMLTIAIPNYYFKNPLLRHYIWKEVLKRSKVQPENNEIELQSI